MLIWTSVQPFYAVPSADSLARVTFEGYVKIWQESTVMRALWNTTVLALVTSAATILLAVLVSWFVVRRSRAADGLSHYLATVSFLPQCVPSIVIGLAFIFVYVRFPIPIYGTLWIIALAMTTRYLAYSSRTMTSALMQVHGELEEASQMCRRAVGAHLAQNHHAAIGARYDQRVFLGGGARDAGAIDGSDALQSATRWSFRR